MNLLARSALLLGLSIALTGHSTDAVKLPPEREAATRLQVFLDKAEFAPGKIDGRYGEFTLQALALYRGSKGGLAPAEPPKAKSKNTSAPDLSGLDLAGIEPLFIPYTVTDSDAKLIGEVPDSVEAQSKQDRLPYTKIAELVAEKFHCDQKFLAELNPGTTDALKAGDQVMVPNVEPFDLNGLDSMKFGEDLAGKADAEAAKAKDGGGKKKKAKTNAKANEKPALTTKAEVDIKSETLRVLEGDKIIAAYPVTVGSEHTESPVGDWKVRGFERLPKFRYDTAMLEKGERSEHFHMLPAGPNNPVGVLWIALDKKGIGVHGTSDPDSIGRSVSHGCIRLANWDVVRLARKIKAGVPVSIH